MLINSEFLLDMLWNVIGLQELERLPNLAIVKWSLFWLHLCLLMARFDTSCWEMDEEDYLNVLNAE